jgi:SulP family sulfate permease
MSDSTAWQRLLQWLPGLRVVVEYDRTCFLADLTAGLVVSLVVIPSAIAYADLANCSPVAGLYAALGGMIAFALFTSSRHVVTGPDAAIAILVGAAVGPLSKGDPGQAVVLSTWLALLAGIILLLAGWLKLGGIAEFLSSPVMLGFMNGAAVVIIVSQIGKFTGIRLDEENTLYRFVEWCGRLGETKWLSLGCGLMAIAVLLAIRWWYPSVPGTIVIFALAMIAGQWIDFPARAVQVIGAVDTRVPSPIPPELSLAEVGQMLTAALGLALLIFPEGVLLGRAMGERHRYDIQPDQELIALGMANMAAGLLRSFAVGASQSRTLLNSATGGRTQLVSLIAAVLLVGFMFFLADWIATIPTVAIAAILIFTGLTLIDMNGYRRLAQQHPRSGIIAIITSIGVVALGVLPGILIGIVLSLLDVISRIARPQDALLGRVPGSPALHDVGDDESAQTISGLVVYRFYGPLVFANVRFFIERLESFLAGETQPVRQVILDARAIPEIDVTAAEQLQSFVARLEERGIKLVVAEAHLPLREAAIRLGLGSTFAEHESYLKLSVAVAAYEHSAARPKG